MVKLSIIISGVLKKNSLQSLKHDKHKDQILQLTVLIVCKCEFSTVESYKIHYLSQST